MRTQFIELLEKRAEVDDKIFLLCGDLGFSVLESFREKFPKRFLNVGIAEQNMAGIAAGLAKEGYKVFIYSIGNFPSLRALEQVRYDICYHEFDVTIVSVGAGFAYGPLGCSHHATEDLAIMRSLPNMIVYNPADPIEVKWSLEEIFKSKKASYLRLGKAGEPIVREGKNLDPNEVQILRGDKVLVISTGSIIEELKRSIKSLDSNVALWSIYKLNNECITNHIEELKKFTKIITVEESQLNGGFGSFILERINDINLHLSVKRFGIENKFINYSGTQSFLRATIVKNFVDYLKSDLLNL